MLGRLDPGVATDYSDLDERRIELEQGDRVSISVDSPASTLSPSLWLYDAAGNNVVYDDRQRYGPDSDAFISVCQATSSGTYVLIVSKDYYSGEYPGAYELHAERARGIQQEYDLSYTKDSLGGANTLTLAVSGTHRTATVSGTIMAAEGSNADEDVDNLGAVKPSFLPARQTRITLFRNRWAGST